MAKPKPRSRNRFVMSSISAGESQTSLPPQQQEQTAIKGCKRSVITFARLEVVCNSLMPEAMITQFGFFPKTTIKSAFIQGSSPFIEQSATFLNGKNNNDDIPCLKEVVLGVEALWIKETRTIAGAEAERQKGIAEKGRTDAAVSPSNPHHYSTPASSHPPPRNPCFKFQSLPSSMRSPRNCVINICRERWSL